MLNESATPSYHDKFMKKLEEDKKAGINCGCGNCDGFIDFEKAIDHLGSVFHPCKKCGLIHNYYGHVVFFKAFSIGYSKDLRVEYEPCELSELSNNDTKKPLENPNPTVLPCQGKDCAGSVDITQEFQHGFEMYSLCKKCGLIHTKNGGRQLFHYPVRGYFRNEKIVFQK